MAAQQLIDTRLRIGRLLAQIRESKGLTQQQVADASGLIQTNLSKIENGKYNVSIDVLTRITDALDCEIDFTPKK